MGVNCTGGTVMVGAGEINMCCGNVKDKIEMFKRKQYEKYLEAEKNQS